MEVQKRIQHKRSARERTPQEAAGAKASRAASCSPADHNQRGEGGTVQNGPALTHIQPVAIVPRRHLAMSVKCHVLVQNIFRGLGRRVTQRTRNARSTSFPTA
jgi:hypothetical protein